MKGAVERQLLSGGMAERRAQRRLKRAGFLATLATGAALLASAVTGIASVDERLQTATLTATEEPAKFTTVGTGDQPSAGRGAGCDRSTPAHGDLS